MNAVPNRRSAIGLALAGLAAVLVGLAGCDGERKLVAGQHTEHDVRQVMGVPTTIWDLPDGGREWDYVRAPHGWETVRVRIGADGRYQGMRNLLTDENFANAKPGMSLDELTRLFGKPTDSASYHLKPDEVVWSWRYRGLDGIKYRFNAYLDQASGRAKHFNRTDDPQERAG
ncbi:MAG TPA: outer membrane protein assembly factor BamE [Burkholderiaceae bacterium]|nr:outer membrane protein assembly factor BamE [Burkholderiaceae bacterium]